MLDKKEKGPDTSFSILPNELEQLCIQTKRAWSALGKIGYEKKPCEENNIRFIGAHHKLIKMMGDKIQAKKIAKEFEWDGEFKLDRTKPDGVPEKKVDPNLGEKILGWLPEVSIDEGIKLTVEWFIENGHRSNSLRNGFKEAKEIAKKIKEYADGCTKETTKRKSIRSSRY